MNLTVDAPSLTLSTPSYTPTTQTVSGTPENGFDVTYQITDNSPVPASTVSVALVLTPGSGPIPAVVPDVAVGFTCADSLGARPSPCPNLSATGFASSGTINLAAPIPANDTVTITYFEFNAGGADRLPGRIR